MAKLVSQVYAEALFGLGVENGLLDTLLEELNGMCEILGKNPQFVTLLGHPELDQKEKTAVFDRVFDGKISKELNGFCHLLLEKGRFGELFAIREDYERRCLAYHKIGVVYVTVQKNFRILRRRTSVRNFWLRLTLYRCRFIIRWMLR